MARQRLARYPASSTESQWYFTRQELARSPSIQQGMDPREEMRNRQRMIQILWHFRNASKHPQLVINTAATILQRFYMRVPFQTWDKYTAVAAAFFLASKVEERPANSKTVTAWLRHVCRTPGLEFKLRESDYALPDFVKQRKDILHYEETMLRMECFDMNLRHPQALLGKAVERIWGNVEGGGGGGKGKERGKDTEVDTTQLLDCAWCIANDTLAAPTCLLYRPQLIAACCFLLACVLQRKPLPAKPPPVSDQRTLWDLDREEGEEEDGENGFEEEVYWLEWFEVGSDELKDPILYILDTWESATDPFVPYEKERLRPRVLRAIEELPPWTRAIKGQAAVTGEESVTNGDVSKSDGEDVKMEDPRA
ncbi:hypothetical protein JCM16303_000566 [Sporobolomyces ruberrimus]